MAEAGHGRRVLTEVHRGPLKGDPVYRAEQVRSDVSKDMPLPQPKSMMMMLETRISNQHNFTISQRPRSSIARFEQNTQNTTPPK